jgi:hypothetical protein
MGVSVNSNAYAYNYWGSKFNEYQKSRSEFFGSQYLLDRTQKQHVKMAQNSYNSQLAGHTECLILSATLQSRKARAYDN